MSNTSQTFAEWASINRQPLFASKNCHFWKIRMKIFLESVDKGVWDVVVNGHFQPTKMAEGKAVHKEFSLCSLGESKKGTF